MGDLSEKLQISTKRLESKNTFQPFLCSDLLLFCDDLLQLGKAGERVLLGQVRLTLDQGQRILDELVVHAVARFVDPLAGDLLLHVGHFISGMSLVRQAYFPFCTPRSKPIIRPLMPLTAFSTATLPAM